MSLILSGTDGLSDVDGSAATPAIRGTDANTGIFFPAADTIAFAEGGAEVARFDSSGNLGIGTASPATKLNLGGSADQAFQINGSGTAAFLGTSTSVAQISSNRNPATGAIYDSGRAVSYINLEASSGNANIQFYTTATNNVNATERARIDSSGNLALGGTTASSVISGTATVFQVTNNNLAAITLNHTSAKKFSISSQTTSSLVFYDETANTERARIDSSGNLLVGTTNASGTAGIGFKFLPSATYSRTNQVGSATSNSDTTHEVYSTGASAYRFYVGYGGTVFATSITITAISDQRLKENVRDIDTGLSSIMALKPRRFDWKEGKGQDKKNVAGFIAQEFEDVFPECVSTSMAGGDGVEYKNINHETLIPTLVKAIQEQQALITTLTARITALESA